MGMNGSSATEDSKPSKNCEVNTCTGKCPFQMLLKPGGGYACGPGCKRYNAQNFVTGQELIAEARRARASHASQ